MQKPLVTFYTRAYNSEKYIEKTIKSVLNQSEKNIEYILINNGSNDKTGEICKKYAEIDKRIIYLENEKNTVLNPEYKGKWTKPNGEYYSILDADDYLDLDFVKTMYPIAKSINADMVICGTNTVLEDDDSIISTRVPPKLLTTNIEEVGEYFEEIYKSLRVVWAKMFKTKFFQENVTYAWDKPNWMKSGSDTFAVLRYLSKCKAFASINKSLHYYRTHNDSFYNTDISTTRIKTYKILYEEGIKLLKVLDAQTDENINFLQDVHMGSITDCLRNAASNVSKEISDRLSLVDSIVKDDFFCSYAMTNENRKITTGVIKDIINLMTKDISFLELSKIENNFIARIYKDNEDLSSLLAAVCSKDNNHLWGIELLEKEKDRMPEYVREVLFDSSEELRDLLRSPKKLREKFNTNLYLADEKFILNDFAYNNNLEEAIPVLISILEKNILDREGLYFKMYISWQIGEKEVAVKTAETAKVFYADDKDLMIMCGDIFLNIDSIHNAKECYLNAVNNCDDEVIKSDLYNRIKELSLC